MKDHEFNQVLRYLGRPVTYYPLVAKVFRGNVNCAIFLSNFYFWEGKQVDPDGWIYKSSADIKKETGLSRHKQDNARKVLKEKSILEEKLAGTPATTHYRFNWAVLNKLLSQEAVKMDKPKAPNLVYQMKVIFCDKYEDYYDMTFEWIEGRDFGATKKLKDIFVQRVEERHEKDGTQVTDLDQEVITNFKMFLDMLPEYHLKRNLTPSLLRSNFSKIIMDIKNENTAKQADDKRAKQGDDFTGTRRPIGSDQNA